VSGVLSVLRLVEEGVHLRRVLEEEKQMNKTNRRNFLRGLGASAGVIATGGVAATEVVTNKIVRDVVEHRAVYSDVYMLEGDGSQDGDIAMIKINGTYRSCVRRDGKWGTLFPS